MEDKRRLQKEYKQVPIVMKIAFTIDFKSTYWHNT